MMKSSVACNVVLGLFFSTTSAFSTMIEKGTQTISTDVSAKNSLEHIKVQNDKKDDLFFDFSGLEDLIKLKAQEKPKYDDPLQKLNGKNLSQAPLSEEMYNFIERKVGTSNKRSFVFKTGPQIIFEDEIDLLK